MTLARHFPYIFKSLCTDCNSQNSLIHLNSANLSKHKSFLQSGPEMLGCQLLMPLLVNNGNDIEMVIWIYEGNISLVKTANENGQEGEINLFLKISGLSPVFSINLPFSVSKNVWKFYSCI